MDDLTYTLRQLCQRNRDGSYATQADRQGFLALAARQLREARFRQMRATSLKGKHVDVLLQRWQAEGLSTGTLKNRLSHLRWWAEKSARRASFQRETPNWAFPSATMCPTRTKRRRWATGWTGSPIPMCA